jgi:hypothetical protein
MRLRCARTHFSSSPSPLLAMPMSFYGIETFNRIPTDHRSPHRLASKILGVASKAITLRLMLRIRCERTAPKWRLCRPNQTLAKADGSSLLLRAAAAVFFVFLLLAVLPKIGGRLLPAVARAIPLFDAACRLRCTCVGAVQKWRTEIAGWL